MLRDKDMAVFMKVEDGCLPRYNSTFTTQSLPNGLSVMCFSFA